MGREVLKCLVGSHRRPKRARRCECHERLRSAQDATAERYVITREPSGVAAGVPMLMVCVHEVQDVLMEA